MKNLVPGTRIHTHSYVAIWELIDTGGVPLRVLAANEYPRNLGGENPGTRECLGLFWASSRVLVERRVHGYS